MKDGDGVDAAVEDCCVKRDSMSSILIVVWMLGESMMIIASERRFVDFSVVLSGGGSWHLSFGGWQWLRIRG
jgi:hypothetical protein